MRHKDPSIKEAGGYTTGHTWSKETRVKKGEKQRKGVVSANGNNGNTMTLFGRKNAQPSETTERGMKVI